MTGGAVYEPDRALVTPEVARRVTAFFDGDAEADEVLGSAYWWRILNRISRADETRTVFLACDFAPEVSAVWLAKYTEDGRTWLRSLAQERKQQPARRANMARPGAGWC